MISLFNEKRINAFGLDISEFSIKTMQLEQSRGGILPRAFSRLALPDKLFNNHLIASPEKLAEYVTRAVTAAGKLNTKYVVASVPEAKSFLRIVKVPKMGDAELEGAIPYELEQDIPVPIEQVYMDWQIIGEVGNDYNVLVTATPKDYIDAYVETLKMAGLKPVALELESQATARALIAKEDYGQATLILDMAADQTSFMIVIGNGVLEYTSSIPIAGNSFNESISRTLGVSAGEAEKMKRESGLLADNKKGNIRQALIPILDSIIDEIKNVAKFHIDHAADKKEISKVLLSGGSAALPGVADYIAARMNLGAGHPIGKIGLADPWINIANTDQARQKISLTVEESIGMSTVIGLALRGVNFQG